MRLLCCIYSVSQYPAAQCHWVYCRAETVAVRCAGLCACPCVGQRQRPLVKNTFATTTDDELVQLCKKKSLQLCSGHQYHDLSLLFCTEIM